MQNKMEELLRELSDIYIEEGLNLTDGQIIHHAVWKLLQDKKFKHNSDIHAYKWREYDITV